MVLAGLLVSSAAVAEDWPEWRGAGRRGVWNEEGILEELPASGLAYTWKASIGEGYAGPAVADGRVFVADFVRSEGLRGTERLVCLDERSGKRVWVREWPVDYSGTEPKWANGPRATPTVDANRVFFAGGAGRLVALDVATGETSWQHDYVAEYAAVLPTWGFASAPVVHGKLLLALVGGEEGALVVAFDKTSGKEVWRAGESNGESGYAPPILIEVGGATWLVVWHPAGITALDPATGRVLWEHGFPTRMGMTVATPVVDGNRLFVSAFFDGARLLQIDPETPGVREVWHRHGKSELPDQTDGLHALITTPVLDGEMIFGIDSYGEMRGLRVSDGERLWASKQPVGEQARWAAGLIVRNDDRYFINNDRGELIIARLRRDGYREISRAALIEPTSGGGGRRERDAVVWSHPAYANRHIVARNDREIVRASLAATVEGPAAPAKGSRRGRGGTRKPGREDDR